MAVHCRRQLVVAQVIALSGIKAHGAQNEIWLELAGDRDDDRFEEE